MQSRFQYDPRIAIAVALGDQVHSFFNSDIGQAVIERACSEAEAINQELLEYDILNDPAGAKKLQDRFWIAIKGVKYLNDMLIGGELYERQALEGDALE